MFDRRPKSSFVLPPIPPAAFAVAAAVLAVAAGLWVLSRPSGAAARLDALERQAASIRTAAAAPGDLTVFPAGSVCTNRIDDGFRQQLSNAVTGSGLKVDALDIRPEGRVEGKRPLMAYTVTLKGSGTYEQALGGLEVLDRFRPRLFLDNLSLRNRIDSVTLDLEGRLYCRWTQQS
ncbi:hypothetical protein ABI_12960 [Asticcacaulis biprosthecium C19]|uniref:Uncharacterized protein n=2 Tax=Asticcacaulis biprosthecium TaxID=76891 RepID=F4QHX1_9CAUL|nr:hypothetical protein ABI_12960 [Asticcacaulis biprosthecium C19]